jgi:hypothetical protein
LITVSKDELNRRKAKYEVNCFLNQGEMNLKKVNEMINLVNSKQVETEEKIQLSIKKQQEKL